MTSLPTGTVTFLFTDIEGSTERWDKFPDAMRAALERHDALMHAAVESNAGQVFKTVGDAFCAAFATAGAGLSAAIDAQRAISTEDWVAFGEAFPPILVRMGLHTGEATERGGDYFGQPVNRVARIEAAGHGGQVLLSSIAAGIVRSHVIASGVIASVPGIDGHIFAGVILLAIFTVRAVFIAGAAALYGFADAQLFDAREGDADACSPAIGVRIAAVGDGLQGALANVGVRTAVLGFRIALATEREHAFAGLGAIVVLRTAAFNRGALTP